MRFLELGLKTFDHSLLGIKNVNLRGYQKPYFHNLDISEKQRNSVCLRERERTSGWMKRAIGSIKSVPRAFKSLAPIVHEESCITYL